MVLCQCVFKQIYIPDDIYFEIYILAPKALEAKYIYITRYIFFQKIYIISQIYISFLGAEGAEKILVY